MEANVIIAGFGFAATLTSAWLAAWLQRRSGRQAQLLDAKVQALGECAAALYAYETATYNRVKSRLDLPSQNRDGLRQIAYELAAQARAAMARCAVLASDGEWHRTLEQIHAHVGKYSRADSHEELKQRHDVFLRCISRFLDSARRELAR